MITHDSLTMLFCWEMLENNDIPCVLVPLLEIKPWIKLNAKGEKELYED